MDKLKPAPAIPDQQPEPPAGPAALPFTDTKPVGAADFYFAINATFRFIEKEFGPEGLRRYWQDLGSRYYAQVTAAWKRGGLPAVAWRDRHIIPNGEIRPGVRTAEVWSLRLSRAAAGD